MIYAPYGTGSKKDYRGPGYAINWRTGQCVTLGYLRTLDPIDYDTDGDDDDTAHILFTPTDLATGGGIIKPYDNGVTLSKGFSSFCNVNLLDHLEHNIPKVCV